MQRLSLLLIPGLIASAVFIGISSFESVNIQDGLQLEAVRLDFDAYSEGINSVRYDESGSISYTLQARRQIHFNNGITEFEAPFIRLYQDGKSPWNIVANSGRIYAGSGSQDGVDQTIDLIGNVEVHTMDDYGNKIVITTEFLTVDPNLNSLETAEAVKVVTDNIEQTSIGMYADLTREIIVLKKDIRGKYESPQQ